MTSKIFLQVKSFSNELLKHTINISLKLTDFPTASTKKKNVSQISVSNWKT